MIKKFSSPKMRNREFVFTPKTEYKLVAERGEANPDLLTFPTWCPRQESNLHHKLRKLAFYPLNYEGPTALWITPELRWASNALISIYLSAGARVQRECRRKLRRPNCALVYKE